MLTGNSLKIGVIVAFSESSISAGPFNLWFVFFVLYYLIQTLKTMLNLMTVMMMTILTIMMMMMSSDDNVYHN